MPATKLALVTGAASGFGFGLCAELLSRGWRVLACLRQVEARRSRFAQLMARYPEQLTLHELDITRPEDRLALLRWLDEHGEGRLDALVNNAGRGSFGASEALPAEELRSLFETNYFATVAMTNEFLPLLRASGGHVLVVGSVLGVTGFPMTSAYCASKFALEGHFESLAMELKPHGVAVSLVEPGGHKTGFMDQASWHLSASGTYHGQEQGYQRMQAKVRARGGTPAERAVKKMARAMERRRPPVYLPCGPDAWVMILVRRLLGRRWHLALMTRLSQSLFQPQSKP